MSFAANIVDGLRFLSYRLRYPSRSDLLRQSFGIARRSRDFSSHWEQHCALSRAFIRQSLANQFAARSLIVIGAGRLLDLDLLDAASRLEEIHLIDYDPTLISQWKRYQAVARPCKIHLHTLDVTGIFESIPRSLRHLLLQHRVGDSIVRIREHLAERLADIKPISFPKSDIVLSLNIISQLPILLRERLISEMLKAEVAKSEEQLPEELTQEIDKLCCAVQHAHLELLRALGKRSVILITDRQFEYYRPDQEQRQIEPALFIDVERSMAQMKLLQHTEWFWHIAPFGKNPEPYGSEHVVGAWQWEIGIGANSRPD